MSWTMKPLLTLIALGSIGLVAITPMPYALLLLPVAIGAIGLATNFTNGEVADYNQWHDSKPKNKKKDNQHEYLESPEAKASTNT